MRLAIKRVQLIYYLSQRTIKSRAVGSGSTLPYGPNFNMYSDMINWIKGYLGSRSSLPAEFLGSNAVND